MRERKWVRTPGGRIKRYQSRQKDQPWLRICPHRRKWTQRSRRQKVRQALHPGNWCGDLEIQRRGGWVADATLPRRWRWVEVASRWEEADLVLEVRTGTWFN